jgi:glycosyltransferase involved in cell wall biosynthesis
MNLVYLSAAKIPSREANSIHIMKMCQAFAQLGHRVTLLAPDLQRGLEARVRDPFEFYGVKQCFELRKLPCRVEKGWAWLYGWEAGRLARRLGADWAFGRSLHCCAVAARSGVPTMWDEHMFTFLDRGRERWLFRWMLGASAFRGMSVNCDALRRDIVKRVPGLQGRVLVAHNGADPLPDDLEPADLGETGGRLQVGYVGHLYPGKGFELIRQVAERAPWADFHVVGGDRKSLDRLQRDTMIPANIQLHGFFPPSETDRLSLAFDVLLAPYQARVQTAGGGDTAAWMSPLKLFEYMAVGKAILCSDMPVLREIIEDDYNGLLLPAEDADAWVAALRRLHDAPGERRRLGAAARTDFLARHTWLRRARVVERCFADGFPDDGPEELIEGSAGLELLRPIGNDGAHRARHAAALRATKEKL